MRKTAAREALEELLEQLGKAVGKDASFEVDDRGGYHKVSWENGIPLDTMYAAVKDLPGLKWKKLSETEGYLSLDETGVHHHDRPIISVHRRPSPRALAYGYMALDLAYPCECTDSQTYSEEAFEAYSTSLNRVDADQLEAHPALQDSEYTLEELQQMADLLAVLTEDGERDRVPYEIVYCNIGHMEGLHHLLQPSGPGNQAVTA